MKASMQKLIAMGLCVVLAVGTLTGCNGSDSAKDGNATSGQSTNTKSADKKTFDDLGGMDITIGDWYTSKDTLANRTDTFGKKQNEYWKSIQVHRIMLVLISWMMRKFFCVVKMDLFHAAI